MKRVFRDDEKGFSLIEIIAALAILSMIGGLSYLVYSHQSKAKSDDLSSRARSINVSVPSEWQSRTFEKLDLSIKVPKDWSTDEELYDASPENGDPLRLKSIDITSKNNYDNGIEISKATLNKNNTQKSFEDYLLDTDNSQILKNEAYTKIQTSLKTSYIRINGVRWMERDYDAPNFATTELYIWYQDHAVGLKTGHFSSSDANPDPQRRDKVNSIVTKYLYPVAATLRNTASN